MQPENGRRGIKRIAAALFALALCLGGCSCVKNNDIPASVPLPDATYKVAYIPLDNRPVNRERVCFLAQSADIELVMPDESLYRTALDNMEPNPDGSTIGNRSKLCQWLLAADAECDHFVISLDQMTSGGLVGSRWLCNVDLTFEYEIIDTILGLCENNTVYLFDTVMRLASTVGYQGYQYDEYTALRSYGAQARKILGADELTLQNIVDCYPYDSKGKPIKWDLSEDKLIRYHASRVRKLKLIDYVLRQSGDKVDFFYIGVDDASPQNTIQTNEINYINTLRQENSVLGAAADEMALCCLSRLILELYDVDISADVTYFGNGQDKPADGFDIGTLEQSVNVHLEAIGVGNKVNGKNVLSVLCLTRGAGALERNSLLDRLKENQSKQIPTVLVDASEHPEVFAQMLMEDSGVDICRILGYSSWNTASNAIGIALSQGAGRFGYLLSAKHSTQDADNGFVRGIAFSYIKDISYKCFHPDLDGFMDETGLCSARNILARINNGKVITALDDFAVDLYEEIVISNLRYPWNRTFEMTFEIGFAG